MREKMIAALSIAVFYLGSAASQTHPKHHTRRSELTAGNPVFVPLCENPDFPGSATPIDQQCGVDGSGTPAEAKQNEVKNSFCASNLAEPVDIDQLTQLQNRVMGNRSINFGDRSTANRKKGPTKNREPLQLMGEGKLVVFQGYVLNARQGGPEAVNCGLDAPNEPASHDILISLGDQPGADECSGFVAEMIPHYRPAGWTTENVLKVKTASILMQVAGQLMFDSSHVPCNTHTPARGNPPRVSLWEIHPIYKFEVCTSNCQDEGQWVPLELWVQSH